MTSGLNSIETQLALSGGYATAAASGSTSARLLHNLEYDNYAMLGGKLAGQPAKFNCGLGPLTYWACGVYLMWLDIFAIIRLKYKLEEGKFNSL